MCVFFFFFEHFWVRKFLFRYEGVNIVRWRGFAKVLGSGFLDFVTSGLLNLQMGIFLSFEGFVTLAAQADPPFFCWFAHRMARAHEKTYTSLAGHKGGTPWEMPSVSSLVAAMSVEELRSFSQVPTFIRLEVSDNTTPPTIRGANNVIYFTREQFVVGLRFLIPSLVK